MDSRTAVLLSVSFIVGCSIVAYATLTAQRFRVATAANQAILIDTHSGRTWQRYMPSNQGPTNWSEITVDLER